MTAAVRHATMPRENVWAVRQGKDRTPTGASTTVIMLYASRDIRPSILQRAAAAKQNRYAATDRFIILPLGNALTPYAPSGVWTIVQKAADHVNPDAI